MQVRFWGTRGSIPAALTASALREKLVEVLAAASGRDIDTVEKAKAFADTLPFALTNTFGGNSSCVEVRDEGPGMTAEAADRVFERFYRSDASRSRESGGVGLGLSIVAAVVEAHGGTVSVEAPEGGGATFRITLPLVDVPAGPERPAEPPPGEGKEERGQLGVGESGV